MFQSLLKKLQEGRLSRQEAKKLAKWLKSKRSDRYFADLYDREVKRSDSAELPALSPQQHAALKRTVMQRLEFGSKVQQRPKKLASPKAFALRKWVAAASLLLLLGLGLYLYVPRPMPISPVVKVPALEWVVRSNPAGKKTLIHLPDGSRVYLNSESTLKYAKGFATNRQVHLEGEAYFEVAEDSLHAFTVHADSLRTRVLGTAFNLRSFPEEDLVSVALVSGRIEAGINGSEATEILVPGEGLALTRGAEPGISKFDADLTAVQYWKEGILHFEQVSFLKLIRILERWYGVTIELRGTIPKDSGFTGTFKNHENLINVLDAIQFSEPFTYQSKGKEVIITF
jgi:ferric-dicitrate binding protein FerR (iron transport regulator)